MNIEVPFNLSGVSVLSVVTRLKDIFSPRTFALLSASTIVNEAFRKGTLSYDLFSTLKLTPPVGEDSATTPSVKEFVWFLELLTQMGCTGEPADDEEIVVVRKKNGVQLVAAINRKDEWHEWTEAMQVEISIARDDDGLVLVVPDGVRVVRPAGTVTGRLGTLPPSAPPKDFVTCNQCLCDDGKMQPDAYNSDRYGDYSLVAICDDCNKQRADDL
jgi:hypothetical protein